MKLRLKYTNKDEIPTEHQSLYQERDGAFHLEVEGAVDKSRVDEFRENNLALQKQLRELNAKYQGIDLEAVRKLEEEKAEEARRQKEGEVDQLIENRVRGVREELGKAKSDKDQLLQELSVIKINQAAISAAAARGLRSAAIPDLTNRARAVFRLDPKGNAVAYDGDALRYGKDGTVPLTIEEWAELLKKEAPHLFENSGGGGVDLPLSGAGAADRNPWTKDHWNLTRQGEVWKRDPALADRLKKTAKAGITRGI